MNRMAEKIQAARRKAKLTEKELAKKCGLSVGYIIQIESGKKIIKEEFADKILKALGEKTERLEVEAPKTEQEKVSTKPVRNQSVQSHVTVKPNAQWADALAGVIKNYPVIDCLTNKVVENRELPILNKKIAGYHPEKIMFVRASNNDAKDFRIRKNDIVTVALTTEIQNGQVYVFEVNNKKYIRQIRKENNSKISLYKNIHDEEPEVTELSKVKILGKCVQVEFKL